MGVAQAAISRIERDETHDPGVLIVAAIALALGLSLEDLVAGHVSLPLPTRTLLDQRVARLEALLGVPPLRP